MAVIEASALHRVVFRFAIFGHEFVLLSLKWAHRYWKLDISVERTRCHVAYCSTHPKPGRNRAVRFAIKGTLQANARLGGSSSSLTMSIPGSVEPSQLSITRVSTSRHAHGITSQSHDTASAPPSTLGLINLRTPRPYHSLNDHS